MKNSVFTKEQLAEFGFWQSASKIITTKGNNIKKAAKVFTPEEITKANKALKAGIVSNKYATSLTKQPPLSYKPLGTGYVPLGSKNTPLGSKNKPLGSKKKTQVLGEQNKKLGSSPKIIGLNTIPLGSNKRPLGSKI